MIVSLQQGCWPAIDCAPANLPSTSHPTLTEVVTLAIYGAPLKPGNTHGSFIATACEWHRAQRAIWRCSNGPGWLVYGLERIQRGEGPPFPATTEDDSEKHCNGFFCAASRWLHEGRKIVRDGIPAAAEEVARSLATMSDADAIEAALAEAFRIKTAEAAIEKRAGLVYVRLSEQIIERSLSLEAIASRYNGRDDDDEDVPLPLGPTEPPHRQIPDGWYRLPLAHDVRNNRLEAFLGSTEQEIIDGIFNRSQRQLEDQLHRWSHVCMSRELAEDFLDSLNHHKAAASPTKPLNHSDQASTPTESGQSRRVQYPWATCRRDVMLKLEEEGEPTAESGDPDWRNQASLERFIRDWMITRLGPEMDGPSPSRIRDYASKWLREFRHDKQHGGK